MKVLAVLVLTLAGIGCGVPHEVHEREVREARQEAYSNGLQRGSEIEVAKCEKTIQKINIEHKEEITAAENSSWNQGYALGVGSTVAVLAGIAFLLALIGSNIFLLWKFVQEDSPEL